MRTSFFAPYVGSLILSTDSRFERVAWSIFQRKYSQGWWRCWSPWASSSWYSWECVQFWSAHAGNHFRKAFIFWTKGLTCELGNDNNYGWLHHLNLENTSIPHKASSSNINFHSFSQALECIRDNRSMSCLLDPNLKDHKEKDLEIICELVQDCIQTDPKKRPTMREVTNRLREVLSISPEAATPRLSPLWWAELEILSVEAS